MRLTPANDLEAIDPAAGDWMATGHDPQFWVEPDTPGGLPTGWCHVRFRLSAPDDRAFEPYFYVDHGAGAGESTPRPLRWTEGEVDDLVHVPEGIRALRFDPAEAPGSFRLTDFALRGLAADDPRQTLAPPLNHPAYLDHRLNMVAEGDLEPMDGLAGGWIAKGDDPRFRIRLRRPRSRSRDAWVRIVVDIEPLEDTKLRPLIYVDRGRGFTEADSHALRWRDGRIDDVVRLPGGVTRLRLDPLDRQGRFRLTGCRVERVSRAAAWRILAEKFWATLAPEERRLPALMRESIRLVRLHSAAELRAMVIRRASRPPMEGAYQAWIDEVEGPDRESDEAMREAIAAFRDPPVFSIVVPVYDTPKEWLVAAIESVRAQVYPGWELCLCDDASPAPHVGPLLARCAALDPRIKVHTRTENGHISRASNDALAMATGTHMVLMDHDDLIPPNALYEFARVLDAEPETDFIYSDEDKISIAGIRYRPFFKPDWSPDYLEGCMYTAHLACYDMRIVRRIGGFRPECDGAQDYDFVLRYTEHVRRVRHVPKILYHWRAIPGSTAAEMSNKGYVIEAALRGLAGRAERTGGLDIVRPGPSAGSFELRRPVRGRPLVSIVIPTAGRDAEIRGRTIDLLANCLDRLAAETTYPNLDLVVVDNGDLREPTRDAVRRHGARSVTFTVPEFNVAAKMNLGARAARGDLLLFLNDDTEVITPDWIESLVAAIQVEGVGIAGPKLLFENGDLQNVGVTFCEGLPDEVRRGYPETDAGYGYSSICRRNYMALTGACLMIHRDLFDEIGGFDEALKVNYNDIDLCLKVWSRGFRVVFEPMARLYHFESRSRARSVDPVQASRFRTRWQEVVRRDPFYPEWLQTRPPTFELDPSRF